MEKVTAYEKDPKKVTAGRAGAAARKKNHQVFLDKKRDAKHVVLAGETAPAPEHVGTTAGSMEQLSVGTTAGNMRQLIIMGVVGGGALLLILAALRSGQRQVPTRVMQLKVEKREDMQPSQHFAEFK